jgi:hypothetical protein
MRTNLPWEWEDLDEMSKRSKTVGGWIVLVENKKLNAITSLFVKDSYHEWVILEKPKEAVKETESIDFPVL